jgi:transcriptional regulator with PAS, ATPase and Fis domain
LQAKLLHVLQDRQFYPVGARQPKSVDVRIIAATNRSLEKMVSARQFREDLYYRLNVFDVTLPPLRNRREDLLMLIHHFLHRFNHKYGVNRVLTPEALDALHAYEWPGNVRQLENVMERLVVIGEGAWIGLDDLPDEIVRIGTRDPDISMQHCGSLDRAVEALKRTLIRRSYEKWKSTRKVAQDLAISQSRASQLIRKYCQCENSLEEEVL